MLGWFKAAAFGKPSLDKFVAILTFQALGFFLLSLVFVVGWFLTENPNGLRGFRFTALLGAVQGSLAVAAGIAMLVRRRGKTQDAAH